VGFEEAGVWSLMMNVTEVLGNYGNSSVIV
jgi:hypothetical protein